MDLFGRSSPLSCICASARAEGVAIERVYAVHFLIARLCYGSARRVLILAGARALPLRQGAGADADQVAVGRGHVDLDAGVFKRLPQGKRETSKRQPTIRIPDRLLAHMRRWRDKGISKSAVIEFDGKPVASVKKAFARLVDEAGLDGATQHTLRHTAVTWAMQRGADPYRAAGFFGMSVQIIQRVYGHHHPDYQRDIGDAVTGRTNRHLGAGSGQVRENKQRKTTPNATNNIKNIR